jgi:hypothetical protein
MHAVQEDDAGGEGKGGQLAAESSEARAARIAAAAEAAAAAAQAAAANQRPLAERFPLKRRVRCAWLTQGDCRCAGWWRCRQRGTHSPTTLDVCVPWQVQLSLPELPPDARALLLTMTSFGGRGFKNVKTLQVRERTAYVRTCTCSQVPWDHPAAHGGAASAPLSHVRSARRAGPPAAGAPRRAHRC